MSLFLSYSKIFKEKVFKLVFFPDLKSEVKNSQVVLVYLQNLDLLKYIYERAPSLSHSPTKLILSFLWLGVTW